MSEEARCATCGTLNTFHVNGRPWCAVCRLPPAPQPEGEVLTREEFEIIVNAHIAGRAGGRLLAHDAALRAALAESKKAYDILWEALQRIAGQKPGEGEVLFVDIAAAALAKLNMGSGETQHGTK